MRQREGRHALALTPNEPLSDIQVAPKPPVQIASSKYCYQLCPSLTPPMRVHENANQAQSLECRQRIERCSRAAWYSRELHGRQEFPAFSTCCFLCDILQIS